MTASLEDIKEFVVENWRTLNTAASPGKLPEGHSPDNQNVWMDEKPGSVITARGYQKLGEIPSGNPPTLLLNYFKTSDGSSQLIVSDSATIWYTTDYVNYTSIKTGLASYFQLRAKVIRDKVWFTNGSDPVATWDGSTYTELDGTGGNPNVPRGKYIEYNDERVWLYGIASDLSALRFSALADSSGTEIPPEDADAWPTDNEIQVSEGDADQGTGIFVYRGALYCSKQYTIWRIVGSDEYTYSKVKTRSSTGTRFQESIQSKDNLVHFIGVDGLYIFNGEDSERVSDIIDPASSDEGVFAFRNLQQTLLNSQFWTISDTADINTGTVPRNMDTSGDQILLVPDDTQADFEAGTLSDITATDNPGYIQLALEASGGVYIESTGKSSTLTDNVGVPQIGSATYITDNSEVNYVGFRQTGANSNECKFTIDLGAARPIGRVNIRGFRAETAVGTAFYLVAKIQYSSDGSSWIDATDLLSSLPSYAANTSPSVLGYGGVPPRVAGPSDVNTTFGYVSARYWRLVIGVPSGTYFAIKELDIYRAAYKATGTYTSEAIDFGSAPNSFETLAAEITTNGETYQFFTQSSNDGSTWDAAVNVNNGGEIGSTLRRYLRWGVTLNSAAGVNSPVIDKVYVGSTYLSPIHDTGGNILQWAAFQIDQNLNGGTVVAYYRAASTSGGVSAASWTEIVAGAIPNTAVTNTFIQIRLKFHTTDATRAPSVQGFTVNWVLSSSSGASVLQNVASIIILNRYWLSAATLGATENDVVVVFGKSTAKSPWHIKDFKMLSFCKFLDMNLAGSSEDGSIYRLESGYSKNGAALDSYYETQDFSNANFKIKGRELHVTLDRLGDYDVTVGWSTDGGATWTDKSISVARADGEPLTFTKVLNINFMSDYVRFRVRTNDVDKPFSVDSLKLYYRLSPQRGSLVAAA